MRQVLLTLKITYDGDPTREEIATALSEKLPLLIEGGALTTDGAEITECGIGLLWLPEAAKHGEPGHVCENDNDIDVDPIV